MLRSTIKYKVEWIGALFIEVPTNDRGNVHRGGKTVGCNLT
ncbi:MULTISPECIES: hypothetical protein [Nostocales]|uniref:Uncharacterized protein n=1 Tax=Scytonema tolypothrichoides VB-61278_2 TaxID=3232314 RepID=A0ABW8WS38_9CYAN|nr:hypothetical protein [Tolypothrix bouteillei]